MFLASVCSWLNFVFLGYDLCIGCIYFLLSLYRIVTILSSGGFQVFHVYKFCSYFDSSVWCNFFSCFVLLLDMIFYCEVNITKIFYYYLNSFTLIFTETADLLQNLSLDSENKATNYASKVLAWLILSLLISYFLKVVWLIWLTCSYSLLLLIWANLLHWLGN